jgi:hypothetical protein
MHASAARTTAYTSALMYMQRHFAGTSCSIHVIHVLQCCLRSAKSLNNCFGAITFVTGAVLQLQLHVQLMEAKLLLLH